MQSLKRVTPISEEVSVLYQRPKSFDNMSTIGSEAGSSASSTTTSPANNVLYPADVRFANATSNFKREVVEEKQVHMIRQKVPSHLLTSPTCSTNHTVPSGSSTPPKTPVQGRSIFVNTKLIAQMQLRDMNRFPFKRVQPGLNEAEEEFSQYGNSVSEYDITRKGYEFVVEPLNSPNRPPIDWNKIQLPVKSNLTDLLIYRITNYINPDCEILIGNEAFNTHLIVLQCYSTYFDQMQGPSKVRLAENDVTTRAFVVIYDWMIHSGQNSQHILTLDNILEVFVATQYLGIRELEEQCWAFINNQDIFSEDTAFQLYLQAKHGNHTAISQLMIPRIMRFFLPLVSSRNFLELDVDDLCTILNSHYIAIHSEMEVFMSAVRWLMFDWESRKEYVCPVLSCVRFGLIAPWQLVDIRRNPENPEFLQVTSTSEIQKMMDNGISYAIIRYWYGTQTTDYYHWVGQLALDEPNRRNWINEIKNYVTYRDFVHDLESYQMPGVMENMELRTEQLLTKNDIPDPFVKPPSSIEEYISSRLQLFRSQSVQ